MFVDDERFFSFITSPTVLIVVFLILLFGIFINYRYSRSMIKSMRKIDLEIVDKFDKKTVYLKCQTCNDVTGHIEDVCSVCGCSYEPMYIETNNLKENVIQGKNEALNDTKRKVINGILKGVTPIKLSSINKEYSSTTENNRIKVSTISCTKKELSTTNIVNSEPVK